VECLSPEQVLGERGDERTDVFALGCVQVFHYSILI
jgi:serine/threonine protein kinase